MSSKEFEEYFKNKPLAFEIISEMSKTDYTTIKELMEKLDRSRSTISQTLTQLQKEKYVMEKEDPEDSRKKQFTLAKISELEKMLEVNRAEFEHYSRILKKSLPLHQTIVKNELFNILKDTHKIIMNQNISDGFREIQPDLTLVNTKTEKITYLNIEYINKLDPQKIDQIVGSLINQNTSGIDGNFVKILILPENTTFQSVKYLENKIALANKLTDNRTYIALITIPELEQTNTYQQIIKNAKI